MVILILVNEHRLIMASIQSEIMSKPELFVEPDPELPLALLDQKEVSLINCDLCLACEINLLMYF